MIQFIMEVDLALDEKWLSHAMAKVKATLALPRYEVFSWEIVKASYVRSKKLSVIRVRFYENDADADPEDLRENEEEYLANELDYFNNKISGHFQPGEDYEVSEIEIRWKELTDA